MKIATCNATYDGYHNRRWNAKRIKILDQAIEAAANLGSEVVCFPAGFLCAQSLADLRRLAAALCKIARVRGVMLLLGIDVGSGNYKKSSFRKNRKKRAALPNFAVACGPNAARPLVWRQRSGSRADQQRVSDTDCERKQVLETHGFQMAVITCGELFNERIRGALIATKPNTAVDLCHKAKGFRSHVPMKRIARSGINCIWAGHVSKTHGMKRAFASGGRNLSSRDCDAIVPSKPRIEIKVWNFARFC